MVRGRYIGDSEVAISRLRNYVDRHLIIIRGGIMEVRVAFVKHIQRVERAARTPKREIENIGEAELAVVPLPANIARHIWVRHGPNSKTIPAIETS